MATRLLTNKEIGKKIEKLRLEKGLKQEELGKGHGISATSVYRMVTKGTGITFDMVLKAAELLNADPLELCTTDAKTTAGTVAEVLDAFFLLDRVACFRPVTDEKGQEITDRDGNPAFSFVYPGYSGFLREMLTIHRIASELGDTKEYKELAAAWKEKRLRDTEKKSALYYSIDGYMRGREILRTIRGTVDTKTAHGTDFQAFRKQAETVAEKFSLDDIRRALVVLEPSGLGETDGMTPEETDLFSILKEALHITEEKAENRKKAPRHRVYKKSTT